MTDEQNDPTSVRVWAGNDGKEIGSSINRFWLPKGSKVGRISCSLKEWRYVQKQQASYIDKQPRTQPAVDFAYEDIEATTQIRILELLPAGHGDPLEGRLMVEDLDRLAPFEAVSYCWGPREAVDSIECNGKSLHINAAVSGMLRQFREVDSPRRLWIDAICINQSLKAEKDAQVPLMGDIYSKASTVRIWLGQDDEGSGEAFDLIQETFNVIRTAQEKHGPQPTLAQLFACDLPTDKDARWTSLNDLLNRPWFQRTWILQEVSLAQKAILHSGPHTCPWPTLAHISTILFHTQAHNALNTFAITHAARIAMIAFQDATTVDKTLAGLLVATVGLGVSNLRDRVYALLGLATDGAEFMDLVSYTKSVETLYHEICVHYLIRKRNLSFLNYAGDTPFRGTRALPSWVPDWATANRPIGLRDLGYHGKRRQLLDCGVEPYISPDGRALHIRGFVLDRVHSIGRTLPIEYSISEDEQARILRRWYRLARSSCRQRYSESLLEGFARTLVADNLPGISSLGEVYSAYQSEPSSTSDDEVFRYREALRPACNLRSFFTTCSGAMGLGSYFLRPGDVVVELHGGVTPFAFRDVGRGQWRIVGECFVYGGMEDVRVEGREVVDFELV